MLLVVGGIVALVIGAPVVSCACDEECSQATWQLFDSVRQSNFTPSGLQAQLEAWAANSTAAVSPAAAAVAVAGGNRIAPASSPAAASPAASPAARAAQPRRPAGHGRGMAAMPAAEEQSAKGPDAPDTKLTPEQEQEQLAQGGVGFPAEFPADLDLPADLSDAFAPAWAGGEQLSGDMPPQWEQEPAGDEQFEGDEIQPLAPRPHVCRKVAVLRWMAPRVSGVLQRLHSFVQRLHAPRHASHAGGVAEGPAHGPFRGAHGPRGLLWRGAPPFLAIEDEKADDEDPKQPQPADADFAADAVILPAVVPEPSIDADHTDVDAAEAPSSVPPHFWAHRTHGRWYGKRRSGDDAADSEHDREHSHGKASKHHKHRARNGHHHARVSGEGQHAEGSWGAESGAQGAAHSRFGRPHGLRGALDLLRGAMRAFFHRPAAGPRGPEADAAPDVVVHWQRFDAPPPPPFEVQQASDAAVFNTAADAPPPPVFAGEVQPMTPVEEPVPVPMPLPEGALGPRHAADADGLSAVPSDRAAQAFAPAGVWRVHRLPGMRRLLLEDAAEGHPLDARKHGHEEADSHAEGSGGLLGGKHKKGRPQDDEEWARKYGAAGKASGSKDGSRKGHDEEDDDDDDGVPTEQVLLMQLATWADSVTYDDFMRMADSVCSGGAAMLAIGSVILACAASLLLVAGATARKLAAHPWFVQQDALRRLQRSSRVPTAVPVAVPAGGHDGSGGAVPPAVAAGQQPEPVYRFVPGQGFVPLASPVPMVTGHPVPASAGAADAFPLQQQQQQQPYGRRSRLFGAVSGVLRTGAEMVGTLVRPRTAYAYAPVEEEGGSSGGNTVGIEMGATPSAGNAAAAHNPLAAPPQQAQQQQAQPQIYLPQQQQVPVYHGVAVHGAGGGHAGAYGHYAQPHAMSPATYGHAYPAVPVAASAPGPLPPFGVVGNGAAFVQPPAPTGPAPGSAGAYTYVDMPARR